MIERDLPMTFECDECGLKLVEDTTSEEYGVCWCESCFEKTHRTCAGCKEVMHVDDMSEEFPAYCNCCGFDHRQEIVDELNEKLDVIIGGWARDEDDIDKLRKLLTYARGLTNETDD